MSGGSFDYAYVETARFADDLRNRLDEQGKDRYGDGFTRPAWPPEVADKMARIADAAEYVSRLMKEVEWLYSDDTGEETFLRRVAEIEARRNAHNP